MKALALDYRGILLHADRAAWFNATEIAEAHGKQLQKFWQREETHEYIAALCEHLNHPKTDDLNRPFNPKDYPQFIKTRRGRNGGTWLHPDLMVHFARWINPRFSVWCDQTIKRLLTEQPVWRQQRRELGSITRLKNRLLQEQRAALGKDTQPYHYSNEALMENEALTARTHRPRQPASGRAGHAGHDTGGKRRDDCAKHPFCHPQGAPVRHCRTDTGGNMGTLTCTHDGVTVILKGGRIDSRIVARLLGIKHDNFMQTLERYQNELRTYGVFLFQTGKPPRGTKGGRPEKYAMLNEDQFVFSITLSRNTPRVVQAKKAVVLAFGQARRLLAAQGQYLPAYHALHTAAQQAAAQARGSSAPRPCTAHQSRTAEQQTAWQESGRTCRLHPCRKSRAGDPVPTGTAGNRTDDQRRGRRQAGISGRQERRRCLYAAIRARPDGGSMKRRPTVVMMTTLDTTPTAAQNAARRYMRHGFDSPKLQRQTCRAMRFFHACNTPLRNLLWAARGRGAYARWVRCIQSVNPSFCRPPCV